MTPEQLQGITTHVWVGLTEIISICEVFHPQLLCNFEIVLAGGSQNAVSSKRKALGQELAEGAKAHNPNLQLNGRIARVDQLVFRVILLWGVTGPNTKPCTPGKTFLCDRNSCSW